MLRNIDKPAPNMTKIRPFAALLLLTLIALSDAANARPPERGWELLGSRDVSFYIDQDVIYLGRDKDSFRGIQLRVSKNAIEVLTLKVVYGNGRVQEIPVREFIEPGAHSRPLDLEGEDRTIRQIELLYRSRPEFRGEAHVEVWGRG